MYEARFALLILFEVHFPLVRRLSKDYYALTGSDGSCLLWGCFSCGGSGSLAAACSTPTGEGLVCSIYAPTHLQSLSICPWRDALNCNLHDARVCVCVHECDIKWIALEMFLAGLVTLSPCGLFQR